MYKRCTKGWRMSKLQALLCTPATPSDLRRLEHAADETQETPVNCDETVLPGRGGGGGGGGTGEHALDGLAGEGLGVLELLDGHGGGARHVVVDQRRPHVPAAVGLHPPPGRELESVQLLPEVLNPAPTPSRRFVTDHCPDCNLRPAQREYCKYWKIRSQ